MLKYFLALTIICSLWSCFNGANIVFLAPVPSPSHHNWNRNLYYGLAGRGHNVTVLSPDIDQEKTENVHYIWIDGMYDVLYNGSEEFDFVEMSKSSHFKHIEEFYQFCQISSEAGIKSNGLKTLLNYPDTFKVDLLMIDITVGPYMLGLLEKFKYPPTVAVTAFSYPHFMTHSFGGHRQMSYVPHYDVEYPNDMSLFQRIFNHILTWYDDYMYLSYFLPQQDKLMREYFGEKNLPYVLDLTKHIGLLLSNTHFSVEKLAPLPSSVIPVGGLQIRDAKPLDKGVKEFIEAGKKGSVLFSLGTNVRSDTLGKKAVQMFLNVFREMPDFNFIWKYESDLDLSIPKNVKLQAWVRQSDILAHPNTKGFISHSGLLGTQEAMWHGIPVVGIPFMSDQFRNIVGLIRAEMGVKVDFHTVTHESFKAALKEILENPKYLRNAKKRSSLFKDQINKPLDRAMFWLEWAMRHKDDMKAIESPVKDLGWFKGGGFDVALVLLILVVILLYTFLYFLVKMKNLIFSDKKIKNKKD